MANRNLDINIKTDYDGAGLSRAIADTKSLDAAQRQSNATAASRPTALSGIPAAMPGALSSAPGTGAAMLAQAARPTGAASPQTIGSAPPPPPPRAPFPPSAGSPPAPGSVTSTGNAAR